MFIRKSLRRYYDKWLAGARVINGLDHGLAKMNKIEHTYRLRANFYKWRAQAKAETRRALIEKKCAWFEQQRHKTTTKDCWFTWLEFIRQYKAAKRFMMRGNNGMDRNQLAQAMQKWRNVVAAERHKLFQDNIDELKRRQDDHKKAIERTNQEIDNEKNVKQHTISQMKSLSQRVMANFITRTIHMQAARGFYTWVDVTHNWNKKRRLIKKISNYWAKTDTGRAFRHWSMIHYQEKQQGLKNDLDAVEQRRRALVRQGNLEEAEQERETERLEQELHDKRNTRD